jgi:mRNA degradation ribonuclease J1/J2
LPREPSDQIGSGDVVLFSSRQIPGNEIAIGRIQNQLAGDGITVVTDRQADIHVSGHPGRPELEAIYGWLRPKILMPVHGEMRHMREQAKVGKESGIPTQVVQKNGDLVVWRRAVRVNLPRCRMAASFWMATSSRPPMVRRWLCAADWHGMAC